MPKGLPFELKYSTELLERTDRSIRADKRGHISDAQSILARLQIESGNWLKLTTRFTKVLYGAVGRQQAVTEFCEHLQEKRRPGQANCERLLG
ncbi:hypothetical protein MHN33_00055 [Pseudoalteromonas sp. OOF1S-7]|nr:hypothetical protein [Pseudoalteromonas sp. OOF1S-7]MCG7533371.1 hypothetical protein [Pseudoalteromonas sp. OOF1S-7]